MTIIKRIKSDYKKFSSGGVKKTRYPGPQKPGLPDNFTVDDSQFEDLQKRLREREDDSDAPYKKKRR